MSLKGDRQVFEFNNDFVGSGIMERGGIVSAIPGATTGVATYLKSLTGTASSQGEFARTLSNFIGNAFLPEDMRERKFKVFTEKKGRDLDTMANSLMKRGLIGTAGEHLYGSEKPKETIPEDAYEYKVINGKTYRKLKAK